MGRDLSERIAHPLGEQPEVEEWSAIADTFAGRVHIEWDTTAPVTPLGQLPFFRAGQGLCALGQGCSGSPNFAATHRVRNTNKFHDIMIGAPYGNSDCIHSAPKPAMLSAGFWGSECSHSGLCFAGRRS